MFMLQKNIYKADYAYVSDMYSVKNTGKVRNCFR